MKAIRRIAVGVIVGVILVLILAVIVVIIVVVIVIVAVILVIVVEIVVVLVLVVLEVVIVAATVILVPVVKSIHPLSIEKQTWKILVKFSFHRSRTTFSYFFNQTRIPLIMLYAISCGKCVRVG